VRGALGVRPWAFGAHRGRASRPGETPQKPNAQSRRAVAALLVTLTLLVAPVLSACPVCYGAPDDPMVKSVNNGIWVLLGLVGFVQIGFVALFWSFWRRGRELRRFRESLRVIEGGPHA